MRPEWCKSLAITGLLLSTPVVAQIPGLAPAKAWDLNGYVKYMASGTRPDAGTVAGDSRLDHLLHQRVNFEYRFNSQLRFNLGLRNRLFAGDSSQQPGYGAGIAADSGYFDLSANWLERSGAVGNSQFDRLYLDWQGSDRRGNQWQLRGGRFRINWGMTTLWNPNDLFNSYNIYDFDYEERPGSDALLVSRKLGYASQLDLVWAPAKESDFSRYAARYLTHVNSWDLQLLAGQSALDRVVGGGFAGDIRGAGFRGEVSHFAPRVSQWRGYQLTEATVSSLELDYNFASRRNPSARLALLHNSAPQTTHSGAAPLPLTARTLSFTQFTAYLDYGLDLSALSRITLSGVAYQDGSYNLSSHLGYSLSDEWQLAGVVQRFASGEQSDTESRWTSLFVQLKGSY